MKQESLRVGAELFRHAFMAIDYLEFRFLPGARRRKRMTDHPSSKKHIGKESGSHESLSIREYVMSDRGDVPGWVLVVLMTTGLVTAIWAVAAPRLNAILKNSLDSMNNIR
jgi:hypothetical protein